MAITDDQKLDWYLIPLVINDSPTVDNALVNLGQSLSTQMTNQLNSGMGVIQPRIETILGKALTPTQVARVRAALAKRVNDVLQNTFVS